MKKIVYVAFSAFLIIWINNCAGYKPIFSSENINFEISKYSIKGNKILGKRIYYKLDNLSKSIKDKVNKRSISLTIDVKKDKIATVKDGAGKIKLRGAPKGTGIIAGGPVRAVCEVLGVKDIVAKSMGTANPHNVIRATMKALSKQNSPKHISTIRNKKISQII